MKRTSRFSLTLAIAFSFLISSMPIFAPPAFSQTTYPNNYVAASGAVSTNAAYELGQNPHWFPELQRLGTDYIESGISEENPALIDEGFKILDWGFNKEASDGSFPGCGNVPITTTNVTSATGGVFHTTSLFFEGGCRAVLELRAYHPVTYTLAAGTYDAKLASYSAKLELIASWLTNQTWTAPGASFAVNVGQLGFNYDQYYTHRYGLLAAGLQECSDVTGDQTLVTGPFGANYWIDLGYLRQLTYGTGTFSSTPWQAAILTASISGNTPAPLVAPGAAAPPGTSYLISAFGVDPERTGFDVSYHMVGVLHFTRWWNASTDAARKSEFKVFLTNACQFERTRMSTAGVIDSTGSTRVGVDATQNGEGIKGISTGEVIRGFKEASRIDNKGRDLLASERVADANTLPNTDPISPAGAIGTNTTSAYNITLQRDAADWVQAGIYHENDAQIQQGLTILQWGLAQQASDGSFPLTGSRYTDTAYFIEGASRIVLMLQGYHPISHPLNQALLVSIPNIISAIDASEQYLTINASSGYASTTSASKILVYTACLQESSVVTAASNPTDSAAAATQATKDLNSAFALQLSDGTYSEPVTAFQGNAQATACVMIERLYTYGSLSAPVNAQIVTSLTSGLTKQESVVNIDGSFTYSLPAVVTTTNAFSSGATITGNQAFGVFANRISASSQPIGLN